MRQQDYLDVCSATDKDAFGQRLVNFAQRMDFGLVSAILAVERPGEETLVSTVGNTPADYLQIYEDLEAGKRDPVMRRLKASGAPVVYDQSLYVDAGAGDLWEQQAPFGYRTGISMALHMDEGRHFLLGVDRETPLPGDDNELTRLVADLQLLAVYAQETAVRVLMPAPDRSSTTLPRLSQFEYDLLYWTREGKSGWALAQILDCSEYKVQHHLRMLTRKLGVVGKHAAVHRAMALRLL
jgi:DNA-binding CsgD family transcriptional regulator